MDSFKTQLFTWGMLSSSFKEVAIAFVVVQGIEKLSALLPQYLSTYTKKKIQIKNDNESAETEKTSSMEFHYFANNEDSLIESILEYICKQNNTVFLRYSGNFKPINDKPFSITDYIDCLIKEINYSIDGKLMSFVFEIYSETLTLEALHLWIDGICKEYEIEKKNQMGNKKYFFKEMAFPPMLDDRGNYIWRTAPSHMKFTMIPFSTNKSLDNIFGEDIPEIKKRVDLFMNNKEWYESKGIPHTLGLLLHGEPGTGKSSCIKAIAKDTNRHIIQISLAKFTSQDQLNNLFFTEKIEVVADGQTHFYNIPLNERIYIFEDIDCLSSVVERKKVDTTTQNSLISDMFGNPIRSDNNNNSDETNSKAITLNYLLNLFDGVLETPNRLLIMTTNHRSRLDPALIRPGRIDIDIEFGKLSKGELKRMFEMYYKTNGTKEGPFIFGDNVDKQLTPARVAQIMGAYYDNQEEGYHGILKDVEEQKKREEEERQRREIEERLRREAEERQRREAEERQTIGVRTLGLSEEQNTQTIEEIQNSEPKFVFNDEDNEIINELMGN